MDIYNYSYDYFINFINLLYEKLQSDLSQITLLLVSVVFLCIVIQLNQKIKKIERVQVKDIDDITGFNRLISDEIGLIKNECSELSSVINGSNSINKPIEDKLFNNAPYSQAVHLAQRGYTREEMISLCSLTESEADLILAIHANSKAA